MSERRIAELETSVEDLDREFRFDVDECAGAMAALKRILASATADGSAHAAAPPTTGCPMRMFIHAF